jgi:hypothetical protein
MSEHTPQHHSNPAHRVAPEIDATLIDLVAGDPPVPITVWRTARTTTDAGRGISARLAYRLVAAYSRPGETVVDLTDGHALTAACTAGRRRHHPAWFTDPTGLIIGPATPTHDTVARPADGELPDLGAWFGDDLTDLDLQPAAEPAEPLPHGAVQAATSLVVATWPLDATDAANRVKLAWLLAACARLLRSGGCLVLVVNAPSGAVAMPEDFGPVAAAAAQVGLGYLQHIVAVAADTSAEGDAFVYHVTDEELLALAADTGGQRWPAAHLRVHADLFVFGWAPPPDRPRRTREGGGRRG